MTVYIVHDKLHGGIDSVWSERLRADDRTAEVNGFSKRFSGGSHEWRVVEFELDGESISNREIAREHFQVEKHPPVQRGKHLISTRPKE